MQEANIYILDQNFQSILLITEYLSFLWCERYSSYGDFEIYAYPSTELIQCALKNNYLWKSDTNYMMIIEELELISEVEDGVKLVISGRSLESLLDRRVIWDQTRVRGNINSCVRQLLTEAIINPSEESRKISNFIYKDSTDNFITSTAIDKQYTGDNLFDAIYEICVENDIGFRIYMDDDNNFIFELYKGADRSYKQETNPWVIFSPKYGNLINSNYFESVQLYKNVAVVAGEGEGSLRKRRIIGNTSGVLRRELYIDARDLQSKIDGDNLIIPINFERVIDGGMSIESTANNKVRIRGRAYKKNFTIYADVGTIPTVTRGLYKLSGLTKPYGVPYTFKLSIVGVCESINGEDIEFFTDNTLNNLTVRVTVEVPGNFNIEDIDVMSEIFEPNFKLIEVHYLDYFASLDKRGIEKLSEVTMLEYFEGGIDSSGNLFAYGRDFYMGDLVQVENEFDMTSTARIVEFITSYSENGIEHHPTFQTIQEEV